MRRACRSSRIAGRARAAPSEISAAHQAAGLKWNGNNTSIAVPSVRVLRTRPVVTCSWMTRNARAGHG
ncbi:MAG: hypothetical protein ACRDH0_08085 [Actinomycetota bacterium]